MDHSAVTTPTYLGNMISAADISAELNAEEKKRRLENDFHFKMSREIEERSALMCNLEKENSLYRIVKISREYGIPMETTLSKLKSEKEWDDSEVDRVVQIVYSS